MTLDEGNEPMSGWDSPDALNPDLGLRQENPARSLLLALHHYISFDQVKDRSRPEIRKALEEVWLLMATLDWHAVEFALTATATGQELFSCYSTNDVLTRYQKPTRRDPSQQELFS